MSAEVEPRKLNWIDAPSFLLLNQACLILTQAFDGVPYLVGSSLERRDFRDVDVRLILSDEEYTELFPGIARGLTNARWSVLCSSISLYLRQATGLPVDFQFQAASDANERYPGVRHPLGIFPSPPGDGVRSQWCSCRPDPHTYAEHSDLSGDGGDTPEEDR